jgi:hypothetical protein
LKKIRRYEGGSGGSAKDRTPDSVTIVELTFCNAKKNAGIALGKAWKKRI